MDPQTIEVVLVVAGVLALVGGVAARRSRVAERRRERSAVPARGVVRTVQYTEQGTAVRLRLAWLAPDGSGEREGVWHGGGAPGLGYQVGQQVPVRVGRDDSWVQVTSAPRQSVVDGCVGAAFLVVGVLLLSIAAAIVALTS